MSTLLLLAALLAGVIGLHPLADLVRVPPQVLLTIYGLLLAVPSWAPTLQLDPHLILPVVLPPLLFAATQRTSGREFRDRAVPVLTLAVGLTVATAGLVAVAAHLLGLDWAAAWILGAVVSPPDPVTATSVARQLRLPQRLVTVLEGEGLFNDAAAIVLYATAVAAASGNTFTWSGSTVRLVLAVVVGTGLGIASGVLVRLALRWLHHAAPETTLTVVTPFAAYLGAEHLHGSGVLAVVALGLTLRSHRRTRITAEGWLLGRAVWQYIDFLISSLVFALLGYQFTSVLSQRTPGTRVLLLAGVVIAVVILFRPAWMFPSARLGRVVERREDPTSRSWRDSAVVSWAGMRGVVTVATALALPLTTETGDPFPSRNDIVVVAFLCVLTTLVVQGLSLPLLVRRLGVRASGSALAEVNALRHRAADAALNRLRRDVEDGVPDPVRRAAIQQYEGFIAAREAVAEVHAEEDEKQMTEQLQTLLNRGLEAEREFVHRARMAGEVSTEAADEVLSDIEARAVRDFG
ncbi:MAG TPA: Na+/H+ antiporter [Segeticoccus sp.]|uniref:Na+/H+ antiporter n=1 Tax=Segeticoccus sp. TaxID=2706531 RepID=UPI002D7FA698|nr:Na+/H+ antiporter [Segeticoccus sp.]HET8600170.1 Na+/H+ antiporter [Segeticoccus sp.]